MAYGKELILDLHSCDPDTFNRESIGNFFVELCDNKLDMIREDLHWWDYQNVPEEEVDIEPHLVGTSAVQFIRTSNITIHTLDMLGEIYLNIFSCKDYDEDTVCEFTTEWFKGKVARRKTVVRG